jgi:ABC-type sugar transport system ATPase subunit
MNVVGGDVADRAFRHPTGAVTLGRPARPGATKLGFRPEHAALVEPGAADALDGELYVVEPLGNETLAAVRLGEDIVNVRLPADFGGSAGERVGVRPDRSHLHLFDPDTGDALGAPAAVAEQDTIGAGASRAPRE